MASVQFSTDTIKSLMSFVEEHQDSVKNENEYIEYCNLLMATFNNPPNNPGQSNPAPTNVPHTQYVYECVARGQLVNSFQTNFWDIKVFEKKLVRVYEDNVNRIRTHQTITSPTETITERKHRFSKTVLLEKAKTICDEYRFNECYNRLKYRNKDQIVLWLEHWTHV